MVAKATIFLHDFLCKFLAVLHLMRGSLREESILHLFWCDSARLILRWVWRIRTSAPEGEGRLFFPGLKNGTWQGLKPD